MQRPIVFHDNVSVGIVISENVRIFAASLRERRATLGSDLSMAQRCERHERGTERSGQCTSFA